MDMSFVTPMGPSAPFELVALAIAGIILIASWVILAGSRFVQGGVVERPDRVPQLYGYTMCLIGVLVAVTSLVSVVEHALTFADPAQSTSEWYGWTEPSVTSFEAFRMTYERSQQISGMPTIRSLPDDELRRRYEDLRADRIARNRAVATRGLITSGLTLAIAVALFAFHWRWLRRRVEIAVVATPSG